MYRRAQVRVLRFGLLGLFGLCLVAALPAADQPAHPVLHLVNDDFVPGKLQRSDDGEVLSWRSPYFASPFAFPLNSIKAVYYPVPTPLPKPTGEYCFELTDGDVLFGDLKRWSDEEVELESRMGRLHLQRDQVRRFYRWQGADVIYLGPTGLAGWNGWKEVSPSPWRDDGGQLSTDKPGASIFADVGIPEKAAIEVELSWKGRPNFILALGVQEQDLIGQHAFHLEVWDNDLVVVGESARDADVASVQTIGAGEGQVRVQAYLDQKQRRLILLSRNGQPLATLSLNAKNAQIHSGIRLTNTTGDVRLQHLRVTRWNGLPPRESKVDQARLHRTDGTIVYGTLEGYNPEKKEFTVREGANTTTVKHDLLADVFLTPAQAPEKAPEADKRMLRLITTDGARLRGTLTAIEDAQLTLKNPSIKEPIRISLADLRSLIPTKTDPATKPTLPPGRDGRLELEGLRLKGRLVDGSEPPQASGLMWQPQLSRTASALASGMSGRIVYREPPPPPSVPNMPQAGRVVFLGADAVQRVQPVEVIRRSGITPVRPAPSGAPPSMHLRSGDTIPCEVRSINEKGVTLKTPLTDATFVAHDKIKSVELVSAASPQLDEAKRDRLLTLPRLHKDNPPTHLICSKNGDFLRGRLLEMDENRVKLEVRLETREIPRDRIAQIIWLHPDELTGQKPAAPPGEAPRDNRVQALQAGGNRLTFVLKKADATTVSGVSDVLGACRAKIAEVDQFLFGSFIEESAAKLAYHAWKLHHAAEPKFVQAEAAGAGDGRPSGLESPLVGQPAYAFKLDQLDGKSFQLAQQKGQVVILEFWATWCGPCLQTMPMVEELVREFADRKVQLIAVNLEEQPEQIKGMLERHKLKIPVALDRNGTIAARYGVTAIPQTVVIDREGKVARLFVGGGKKTVEGLRAALEELTR